MEDWTTGEQLESAVGACYTHVRQIFGKKNYQSDSVIRSLGPVLKALAV